MLTDKILLRYTDYECRELSTIAGHTFQMPITALRLIKETCIHYQLLYLLVFFYNSSISLRTKTRQIAIKPLYSSDK